MNWTVTTALWGLAAFLVTRSAARTRLLGLALAIIAGGLLGVGEYQRGRVHGRIEAAVGIGASVTTNLFAAMYSAVVGVMEGGVLTNVSPEETVVISNAAEGVRGAHAGHESQPTRLTRDTQPAQR